jgi:hypothetical protein
LTEQLLTVELPKVAAFFQECGDDVLVVLGKQAIGGVDGPPAPAPASNAAPAPGSNPEGYQYRY